MRLLRHTPRRRCSTLVLVDTPLKARTMARELESGYTVRPTRGYLTRMVAKQEQGTLAATHGVRVEAAQLRRKRVASEHKERLIDSLIEDVEAAASVIVATTPGWRGDAIAKDVADVLDLPDKTRFIRLHRVSGASIRNQTCMEWDIVQAKGVDAENKLALHHLLRGQLTKLIQESLLDPVLKVSMDLHEAWLLKRIVKYEVLFQDGHLRHATLSTNTNRPIYIPRRHRVKHDRQQVPIHLSHQQGKTSIASVFDACLARGHELAIDSFWTAVQALYDMGHLSLVSDTLLYFHENVCITQQLTPDEQAVMDTLQHLDCIYALQLSKTVSRTIIQAGTLPSTVALQWSNEDERIHISDVVAALEDDGWSFESIASRITHLQRCKLIRITNHRIQPTITGVGTLGFLHEFAAPLLESSLHATLHAINASCGVGKLASNLYTYAVKPLLQSARSSILEFRYDDTERKAMLRRIASVPGTEYLVYLGKYGPFVRTAHRGTITNLPRASCVSDITPSFLAYHLQHLGASTALGPHPETGAPLFLRHGREGWAIVYKSRHRVSLSRSQAESMTLDRALRLIDDGPARQTPHEEAAGSG